MKSLLISFALLFSISSAYATASAPKASEPQKVKVCVDVKDKEGKPVKDAKGLTLQEGLSIRLDSETLHVAQQFIASTIAVLLGMSGAAPPLVERITGR